MSVHHNDTGFVEQSHAIRRLLSSNDNSPGGFYEEKAPENTNGIIRINQDEVSLSGLIARLQEIFKSRNDRTVFAQADDSLLFSDVAQLIDSANGAGLARVGLITEQISAR